MLREKYGECQRELQFVFVDLEKTYDRVAKEELWYCMRKLGLSEKYVRVVRDMYEDSEKVVSSVVGVTDRLMGLHQGSALSPYCLQ